MSILQLNLRKSRWLYKSSATGGATIGFVAGSGGTITLTSPYQVFHTYSFAGAGFGFGAGARLPRFGKVNLNIKGRSIGGAGATESFLSYGLVFASDNIIKRDLSPADFRGPCLYVEAGFGVAAGISGSALLFGLDPLRLAALIPMAASPLSANLAIQLLIESANGAILMAGANVGAQLGAGTAAYIGGIF